LELYRDLTNSKNGGSWEMISEYLDEGGWEVEYPTDTKCGYPKNRILSDPGSSIFIRNDGIEKAQYSKWSIREINPI